MKKSVFGAIALLLAAPLANAGELAGVTVPDTVTLAGSELTLNGMGLREKGWFDVYVGSLYLASPSSAAEEVVAGNGPSRVSLTFVRDVGADKIIGGWNDGFAANNDDATMAAIAERKETFNGFFGDIGEGEAMVFDMVPGEGTTVTIAGEEKGTIEGDDFARALRSIWFGPNPPDEDLKEGMLGKE